MSIKALLLALAAALALASARAEEPGRLRVLNWSDYIDPAVIEAFEKDSGLSVEYLTFESVEEFRRRLLTEQPPFDVVVPPISELAGGLDKNHYLNLDKSRIPQAATLDPALLASLARIDADNRRGLPYLWGTTGLGLNMAAVRARVPDAGVHDSWRLLFDVGNARRLADCGIAVLDSAEEVIPLVLRYLGRSPNSLDPADYLAAERLLSQLAPQVRAFSGDYIDDFAAGKYCVVLGFSGDLLQAAARAREAGGKQELRYVMPREGTSLWFDMLAIPRQARAPGNAHRFIDFLLRPENMARISNFTAYANAQTAADALIAPEVKGNPGIYPDAERRQKLFLSTVTARSLDGMRQRIWDNVKRKSRR